MDNQTNHQVWPSAQGIQYEAAHRMHHVSGNLQEALALYKTIILSFPESKEASYAETQIHHIVTATVPKSKLLNAHIKMALEYLALSQ